MKLKAFYKLKNIMGDDAREALSVNELYLYTAGELHFDYQRFLNFCYLNGMRHDGNVVDFCRERYGVECSALIKELFKRPY